MVDVDRGRAIRVRFAWVATGAPPGAATALAHGIVESEARAHGRCGADAPLGWVRSPLGKPSLLSAPDCHFSISHSGQLVAVAFAAVPVGLDVELAGRRGAVRARVWRRFAADEQAHITGSPAGAADTPPKGGRASWPVGVERRLLEVWTKKEAYLKWLGAGVSGDLAAFSALDPAALGVDFWPVGSWTAHGFIGHVCAGQGLAGEVVSTWLDPGASALDHAASGHDRSG